MKQFDLNTTAEEQADLLKTSIFWEMQAVESSFNNDYLDHLTGRITSLEFYQLIKNHHLYEYDAINDCKTWESYCAEVLGKTSEAVDAELLTLNALCEELNALDAPQITKDQALINSSQRLCTLKVLAKTLLNVQAAA